MLDAGQADLLSQVELAVRFGKVAVINDVWRVEPTLVPLLRRSYGGSGVDVSLCLYLNFKSPYTEIKKTHQLTDLSHPSASRREARRHQPRLPPLLLLH